MIKVQEEIDVGVKSWRRQEGMGSSLQWGDWTGLMDCLPRKGRGIADLEIRFRRFSSPMISFFFLSKVK